MSHTPLHAALFEILALLRTVHWNAWVTHWKSAGSDSYSDHLLFQRLYTGDGGGPDIENEIDALGERTIALYGQSGVDLVAIQRRSAVLLDNVHALPSIERALKLEAILLLELVKAVRLCEKTDIALDNFLRTVAEERSTVVYLLQQRRKTNAGAGYGNITAGTRSSGFLLILGTLAAAYGLHALASGPQVAQEY